MPTEYVEKNYADNIQLDHRPFGHILVRSNDPFELSPSYWGEIQLTGEHRTPKYFYKVKEFSLDDQSYHLSLFIDRELEECFLETYIYFQDENPHSIEAHVVNYYYKISSIPPELISVTHSLIYRSISDLQPTTDYKKLACDGEILLNNGYVFGIKNEFVDHFEKITRVSFGKLLSTLDLILN